MAFAQDAKAASVAEVNGTAYMDLDSAVSAFNSQGGTIKLLADCKTELESGKHWITLSRGGTFDLNGHKLTVTGLSGSSVICIDANADVTIKDSSAAGAGSISGASYSIWHDGTGNVTIASGTYGNFHRGGNGSFYVNGGTFTNYAFSNVPNEQGKLELNGGTFKLGIHFNQYSGDCQTVYEVLGEGKTYAVGDEIWTRARVEKLGNVYEFEKFDLVTVVNENDAVASFTCYSSPGSAQKVTYYRTLAAAVAAEKGASYTQDSYVTLLKATNENITIDNDIGMVFEGKADGIFTFKEGNSIYLQEQLPDGVTIKAKCDTYPEENGVKNIIVWGRNSVEVDPNDIIPVDEGVASAAWNSLCVGLVHVHVWKYELGASTINVSCKHPQICAIPADDAVVAIVTLIDESITYNEVPQKIILNTWSNPAYYNGEMPGDDDVVYYDANRNQVTGKPVDAGIYAAKLKFGDKTAEAKLEIAKAEQEAPEVTKSDETIDGKNDGKITDVTEEMEYRRDGESAYTAITGTSVEGLADGKYFVRVKEKKNFYPSPETEVIIEAGEFIPAEDDSTKPDDSAPKTGDDSSIWIWMILLAVSSGIVLAASRRRKV